MRFFTLAFFRLSRPKLQNARVEMGENRFRRSGSRERPTSSVFTHLPDVAHRFRRRGELFFSSTLFSSTTGTGGCVFRRPTSAPTSGSPSLDRTIDVVSCVVVSPSPQFRYASGHRRRSRRLASVRMRLPRYATGARSVSERSDFRLRRHHARGIRVRLPRE